ncbi:DUF4189 domain-containing protein [Cryptosporangium aurantiacum]|uniref:DUF4189 domain-containing protein n=1 Tax=Cryptosporangium aurantiacum TaxID=134849 RepID=A0A1M7TY85_9ACTN|nr:DUF4189 domain-containing protein [Cryptosporangium aurantiacum]SHN75689.1 protein of unknown function [Cryptosporangium aurantiacum]
MNIVKKLVLVAACAVLSPLVSAGPAEAVGGPYYGAIAYSESTAKYGYAWTGAGQAAADARARLYCQQTGATDCVVRVSAYGGWIALATTIPSNPWGWGRAGTRQGAVNFALSGCRTYGGGDACALAIAVDLT